jgi:glycosyltransferase involved in cell wall biosynthesis
LFDASWYAGHYATDRPLSHYMNNRRGNVVSPNTFFDTAYYCGAYPDIPAAGIDPFEHFAQWGVFEGRRPCPGFDADYIWQRYLNRDRSKNPYLLFLQFHRLLGWTGTPDAEETSVTTEQRKATSAGAAFEERPPVFSGVRRAKALAFYLPQFHAIPENDKWWGAGFTEWRNVPRGLPRFKGHFQPRVPRDLGYYELIGTDVIKKQVALAQNAGLYGFCFYYYNFNGHRLLEKPLDAYVGDPDISFPFCLMWANENWTRRWDGMEKDVLISQDYRTDDAPALVADLARYMHDPRYIRIQGRPVLFLYRADIIPDCAKTLIRWRALFKDEHGLEPLLIMSQTFGNNDPRPFGFDAAIEFPPHKFGNGLSRINHQIETLEPGFNTDVRSYDDLVTASLADFPSEFPLVKTVVPSWDNDARKPGNGMVIHGSTPAKFQAWVEAIVTRIETAPVFGERLFCVNAWNEWCEGAYLEPDVHFGYAYLNAFSRGISKAREGARYKMLLVGHDAFPAGAQHLLFNIGMTLRDRFGVQICFVLMGGGKLAARYAEIAPTYVVDPSSDFWPALVGHLNALRNDGYRTAITNSTFSGNIVNVLGDMGFSVCSLIHELRTIITRNNGVEHLKLILTRADEVVFPNRYVRDEIVQAFGAPLKNSSICPQGVYSELAPFDAEVDQTIRESLGLGPQAQIVLNAGYADLRKGVDLFVAIAKFVALVSSQIVFVWVGDVDPAVDIWLLDAIRSDPNSNIRFVPFSDRVSSYMNAADLFLLTSREDPFPSVVLEALGAGVPVAGFKGSGGFVDLLADPKLGLLLPSDNLAEAANTIIRHLAGRANRTPALADYRRDHIATHYDFNAYCFEIMRKVAPAQKISVIVPNYNYEPYLEARIASILNQTHPIFELIVLDDCSTDGSVAEIERVADAFRRDLTLIENPVNAGNVFAQWAKGVAQAKGDLVWIAEADDLAEPGFLDGLAAFFARPDDVLAFSDSSTVDRDGVLQWSSYKSYYETLFPGALATSALFGGHDFLERFLSVKNVILNVSSVLWRRSALTAALDTCAAELRQFRMAGDWRLYVEVCGMGRVGYHADPLNVHRRHDASVTHALRKDSHLDEVSRLHRLVRDRTGAAGVDDRQRRYIDELKAQFGMAPAQTTAPAPVQTRDVRPRVTTRRAEGTQSPPPRSRA